MKPLKSSILLFALVMSACGDLNSPTEPQPLLTDELRADPIGPNATDPIVDAEVPRIGTPDPENPPEEGEPE